MDATYITVPFDVREVFGTRARVPVRGTVNGAPFRTSIVPMGGRHMMIVTKKLRAEAGAKPGDVVEVVLERDPEERTVDVPPDLAAALDAAPGARAAWDKLSYTHRKEHVLAIVEAKRPETRSRRIEKALEMLAAKPKKKAATDPNG